MSIARLKIAVFCLFMAAPVATLLLFGVVDSYGNRQADFPAIGQILRGKKGKMNQFGDAVLERSAARKLAVQLRSWTGYRLVGFVDTDQIVSGEGDWLFLRQEFARGRCLDREEATARLRQIAVLVDLAQASSIDLRISMSPNKSTIYPELLSARMRGYWRCRLDNIATLRRLIKQELPTLIDHAEPLLAEKARHPEVPLYYSTDTHWTQYGGALALRQLVAAIYPGTHVPPPRQSDTTTTKRTDLARMLLLPVTEQAPAVEPLREQDLHTKSANLRTVIAHDSFYRQVDLQIRDLFPDAVVVSAFGTDGDFGAKVMTADRVILNLVERSLLGEVERRALDWDAPMPLAILARNVQRAADCTAFSANGEGQSSRLGAEPGPVIAIRKVAPGHMPCLRLSLAADKATTLIVALPNAHTGAFEGRRAFEYQIAPGSQTIAFVLPGYAAGRSVQLRAAKPVTVLAVEVGEIGAPPAAPSNVQESVQP